MESRQHLSLNDYYLDYTQLLLPTVLIRSLRRRNYTVFFVVLVSVILKVQIVLSPSIFEAPRTEITKPVPITLFDSFAVSENISQSTTQPYFYARALQDLDMEHPFGVDDKCAYQAFGLADSDIKGAGNSSSTRAVVDAVWTNMTCLNLEDHIASWIYGNNSYDVELQNTTIAFRFEKCNETIIIHESNLIGFRSPTQLEDNSTSSDTAVGELDDRPCSSLPQQHPQFVFYSGACSPRLRSGRPGSSSLQACAAVLCSPMAWISKVEVLDSISSRTVSLIPDQDEENFVSIRVNPWKLLFSSIPYKYGGQGIYGLPSKPASAALAFRGLDYTPKTSYPRTILWNRYL